MREDRLFDPEDLDKAYGVYCQYDDGFGSLMYQCDTLAQARSYLENMRADLRGVRVSKGGRRIEGTLFGERMVFEILRRGEM